MLHPEQYRNILSGDVYVIGSGATLDWFPAGFFDGRIVVGANAGCLSAGITPQFVVTKYHEEAWRLHSERPEIPVAVSRYQCGNRNTERISDDCPFIVLEHPHNTCEKWSEADWPAAGGFVASWSTITTAMHFAAHLGASTIIMVGHDCGTLDAAARLEGYYDRAERDIDAEMFPVFDRQSRMVKACLERQYGCSVVSMLPFINANMEGHRWSSFAGSLN